MASPPIAQPSVALPPADHATAPPAVVRIRPGRGWAPLRLRELVEFRELFYFLVWRDVKVRYKQTALGAAWAVIQPFFTMLVFSIFFGRLAKLPSDGVPYPVFAFAALVPWTFFATTLGLSSNSLVSSANLITKVYFPRLIVPLASVLSGVVDLAIAFVVLLGMLAWYGIPLAATALWIPAFALLAIVTAAGVGVWLSALNVEFRDVRYAVPFLVQFWMFATPIAYSSSHVPERWRGLYGLNPMVGVVDGFRWALLGAPRPPGISVAASALAAIVLLITGAYYFRRVERTFADVV